MKLTTKNYRTLPLPAGKSEWFYFDHEVPGFGLRLREGGSRTWIFQYKLGAKQRRMSLGSANAITLEQARNGYEDEDRKSQGASHLYFRVKLGEDPAGDKAGAKAKAAETFGAIADDYLAFKKAELRPRSYADVERHILKHAKPLHRLQLGKITRADIATCISAVRKNSGAVTGNRVRTSLSTFFGWCVGEGLIDQNPVVGTNRSEEKPRKRVLKPDELRLIWRALPDDHYGAIMKLLALTGQREDEIASLHLSELSEIEIATVSEVRGRRSYEVREIRIVPPGEIAELAWSELRDNSSRWPKLRGLGVVLPGERTKNGHKHLVPLSDPARMILTAAAASARRFTADGRPRDFVFGYGDGPFSGWSNSKEKLDARIKELNDGEPLEHWTPHDLRRAFATHANGLGIQPHIVEAALNHRSGHKAGVAGTYNWANYEPEKREALIEWAEHLLAWVENRESNITTLRRPA